jgi:hypothetical protein
MKTSMTLTETELRTRVTNLLYALSQIKVSEPVKKFNREDIYDRQQKFTEDLNHGQIYNDVRVVNPFL